MPSYLQSFNYKLNNNLLPVSTMFREYALDNNSCCLFCSVGPESIFHMFGSCEKLTVLWDTVKSGNSARSGNSAADYFLHLDSWYQEHIIFQGTLILFQGKTYQNTSIFKIWWKNLDIRTFDEGFTKLVPKKLGTFTYDIIMCKQKVQFFLFAVSVKNTSMPYFWAMNEIINQFFHLLYLFDFSELFFSWI